jgi:sedoheptulokinase
MPTLWNFRRFALKIGHSLIPFISGLLGGGGGYWKFRMSSIGGGGGGVINNAIKMDGKASASLTLGIDIGTSSIKTALMCNTSELIVAQNTIEHRAEVVSEKNVMNWREQSVQELLVALDRCIKLLPDDTSKLVKDIVVCGQMHGCVLWNSQSICTIENFAEGNLIQTGVSSLITWEDQRCSNEFLSSLPKSNLPLASGFGCVTLFWLQRHEPKIIDRFDHAGTIMDLVVSYLCGTSQVYISTQNACSWGYYDIENKEWEIEK